jgi:hypothetical protein
MSYGQKIKELHIIYIAGYYSGVGLFLYCARIDIHNGKIHGQGMVQKGRVFGGASKRVFKKRRIWNWSVLKR